MTIDINELRRLAQEASPGPWIAKNTSGAGLEIYMSYPLYPDKDWPAFGTDSAFCKKGLVSYETWTQFPHEVRDAQQSKNALFIAAANPAAVSELLDRLEAAEKERDELRAEIERMEQQEPVAWMDRHGTLYNSVSHVRPSDKPLYVLPGAQPVPSVPREAIEKMLTQLMDIAVSNGANSVSMPDEYVEVAAWLCGIPAQPAPNAVAYLYIGASGYMDLGTDLTDEELEAIPTGWHMLGIVGTRGVDGCFPAQPAPNTPTEQCSQQHRGPAATTSAQEG